MYVARSCSIKSCASLHLKQIFLVISAAIYSLDANTHTHTRDPQEVRAQIAFVAAAVDVQIQIERNHLVRTFLHCCLSCIELGVERV